MPRWYPRRDLPHATPESFVGVVELDRPLVELELHEHQGQLVGVWRDELGRALWTVVASRA